MIKVACVQMQSGIDPETNLKSASELIREAAALGAKFISTPEMTNVMNIRPGPSGVPIHMEADDPTLSALRKLAGELGIWLLIGSLAIKLATEERFANRSFLIGPDGSIHARYDKIHMFDVAVGDGQTYRESKRYRPGTEAVVAETPIGTLGLSICYDLRFPRLYRTLAQAGAQILMCPAAFTKTTGTAHWHSLLRARAIETGCFVIAPAQAGLHEDGRETFGHSLIISPWGEILAEGGADQAGVITADIDLNEVAVARGKIPSLSNDADFQLRK